MRSFLASSCWRVGIRCSNEAGLSENSSAKSKRREAGVRACALMDRTSRRWSLQSAAGRRSDFLPKPAEVKNTCAS